MTLNIANGQNDTSSNLDKIIEGVVKTYADLRECETIRDSLYKNVNDLVVASKIKDSTITLQASIISNQKKILSNISNTELETIRKYDECKEDVKKWRSLSLGLGTFSLGLGTLSFIELLILITK